MLNTLHNHWVKNVYKLSTQSGTTGARLSPTLVIVVQSVESQLHNQGVLPYLFPAFLPQLSPGFFKRITLVYDRLYTQSTVPTIKKIKKK